MPQPPRRDLERLGEARFDGKRLKSALQAIGMTQREFANLIDEDYYQVNRWCNDAPDRPIPKIVKLYVPCLLAMHGVKVQP